MNRRDGCQTKRVPASEHPAHRSLERPLCGVEKLGAVLGNGPDNVAAVGEGRVWLREGLRWKRSGGLREGVTERGRFKKEEG